MDGHAAIGPRSAPRLHEDLSWVDVEGEIVVVHASRETVHLISETGALLWPHLDGSASVADLAEDVAAVFELSAEDALADVMQFLAQMQVEHLVVVDSGGS